METLVNDALHVSGVAKERVQVVGKAAPRIASKSLYVLYWMTGSFRSKQNESLEVAKAVANRMDLPLLVVVTIDAEHYRQGSLRHVTFLLEGLSELEKSLRIKNVLFAVRMDPPLALANNVPAYSILGDEEAGVIGFEKHAHIIVMDKQYLRNQRRANENVAQKAECGVIEVESRLAIPVEHATRNGMKFVDPAVFTSTFFREAKKYVFEITNARVMRKSVMCDLTSLGYVWDKTHANWNADDWLANQEILNDVLDKSGVDISVPPTTGGLYYGGEFSARKLLNIFLAQRIGNYKAQHEKFEETTRVQYGSMLGPYLTFGFITASDILLKLWADTYPPESVTTWIKNLAKREIAYHTCYYVPNYDSFEELLPKSVQQSLVAFANHRIVEHRYSARQWECAETNDEVWNEAQRELLTSGKGMRSNRAMWCKRIAERERNPTAAFALALHLNDKYMLDALDPTSYTSVADCFMRTKAPDLSIPSVPGNFFVQFAREVAKAFFPQTAQDDEMDPRDVRKAISPLTSIGGSGLLLLEG